MADVFISYARSTAAKARMVADALRAENYSVWIDDQLPAHREFSVVIEENLHDAKAVLVLWSQDARISRWVPAEADVAHEADKLVQLSLDGTIPPLPFNRMHCEQAPDWNGNRTDRAWRKVLASVAELVGRVADTSAATTTDQLIPPDVKKEPLLAVLPFDNVSADAELTYFCDGVSEEIQRAVASGTRLKVVARSSSFQFRGADKDTAKVAAALGASHLLDGSVRRSGPRIRISAELVECATRNAIWGDRFDGDLEDVFTLQESIAEAVASALKVALAPSVSSSPFPPGIYEVFLRARSILAEGDQQFDDSASLAIPLLEKVIGAAPDFAPAWEALAIARAWNLRSPHKEGDYDAGRDGVLEAANTALQLDPGRSGALKSLAMLEPWGAYSARETLLKKALAASPHDPAVLTDMSNFCWTVGRFREALRFAEQACELNPMMPAARIHVAQMHAYVGEYDTCIRMHQELRREWPKSAGILLSLLNCSATLGYWAAYDEAIGDIEDFDGPLGADLHATKTYAETVRANDPQLTDKRIARYTQMLEKTGTLPINLIVGISVFGRPEEALALAERSSYEHIFELDGAHASPYYPGTMLGPWSTINRIPRFVSLCDRLGLCRYWTNSGTFPDCTEWVPYDFEVEVRQIAGISA